MADITLDLPYLVGCAIPGAIAGDFVSNGDPLTTAVVAFSTAATCEFISVNEHPTQKELRLQLRTAPMFGLGIAYAVARYGGYSVEGALIPALVGGLIAGVAVRSMGAKKLKINTSGWGKFEDVQAYPHINPSGGPPTVPGAVNDVY